MKNKPTAAVLVFLLGWFAAEVLPERASQAAVVAVAAARGWRAGPDCAHPVSHHVRGGVRPPLQRYCQRVTRFSPVPVPPGQDHRRQRPCLQT